MGKKSQADKQIERMGRRIRKAPHMRRFGGYGWTVVLLPLDVFESRFVARMFFGTVYGFEPDDICELRARRIAKGKSKRVRTWWVMAIRNETFGAKLSEEGRKAWLKTSGPYPS